MSIIPANRVMSAPLAGISDTVHRRWARRFGAGLVFTGMVSAEGFRRNPKRYSSIISFDESERPIGVQLFGDSPESFAESAKMMEDFGFDLIDINLGCPARKIVSSGSGSALLKSPGSIAKIICSVKTSVKIPVSAKIRAGWNEGDNSFLDVIPVLIEEGIDFITFHPRSRASMFSGSADWSLITKAVEISNVPIVGNGDIFSGEDAKRMIDETGCSAVMIGRGSLGNPWIFSEAESAISGKNLLPKPTDEVRINALIEFVADLVEYYGERRGMLNSRKFIIWFTSGIKGARTVRSRIYNIKKFEDLLETASIIRENRIETEITFTVI